MKALQINLNVMSTLYITIKDKQIRAVNTSSNDTDR